MFSSRQLVCVDQDAVVELQGLDVHGGGRALKALSGTREGASVPQRRHGSAVVSTRRSS